MFLLKKTLESGQQTMFTLNQSTLLQKRSESLNQKNSTRGVVQSTGQEHTTQAKQAEDITRRMLTDSTRRAVAEEELDGRAEHGGHERRGDGRGAGGGARLGGVGGEGDAGEGGHGDGRDVGSTQHLGGGHDDGEI